ncbi:MFS transporter [Streptomyces shenzhenensis]|uniref:MFS transporter n=1 Tax=Streptomyces shenzhenensis TaxID=943815 RepID=UPI0033CAD65B
MSVNVDGASGVTRQSTGSGRAPRAAAGRGRIVILALLFAVTAINYLDRSNLSIAMPHIKEEFGLSATQQGLLLSSFSWAYVVAQLPGGLFVDRVGPRVAYAWAIVTWSVATAATFLTRGFASVLGARLALGAAEAPSYPANNALVTKWFPSSERARATSVYIAGQFIGLAVALPLLSLIVASFGWRSVFVFTGMLGIVFVVLWLRLARDTPPADGPEAARAPESAKARISRSDVRYLLSRKRLWGLYISQFCSNGVMWFFLTWFPTYLVEAKGITFIRAGFMGMVPYLAALCGVLLSGWWSDRLLRSGVSTTRARKVPIMTGFTLATVIVLANYTSAPGLIIAVMSVAFFAQGLSAIGWTLASEVIPLRMIGTGGGMFNLFTNMGGALVPLVIGVILDATGSFNGALVFMACLTVCGLLSYLLLIDRVERLDPDASR